HRGQPDHLRRGQLPRVAGPGGKIRHRAGLASRTRPAPRRRAPSRHRLRLLFRTHRLRQGDLDLASYGWGTWGSRSVVIGGGAAGRAADIVASQLRQVAAFLLEASPAGVELAEGTARIRR